MRAKDWGRGRSDLLVLAVISVYRVFKWLWSYEAKLEFDFAAR